MSLVGSRLNDPGGGGPVGFGGVRRYEARMTVWAGSHAEESKSRKKISRILEAAAAILSYLLHLGTENNWMIFFRQRFWRPEVLFFDTGSGLGSRKKQPTARDVLT